jgi:hypothetical protein
MPKQVKRTIYLFIYFTKGAFFVKNTFWKEKPVLDI